ncbi:hypothetical protein O7626_18995 [Micromonospora sp. WMMD1102]|uniref:hypothetical protein n=1 Tax=Micromonospora sp. WMMD1102 TaxID=3016105 RepID=UPI0024159321|nr:hypothetical protein [Micromonospora sp. WMMD1102]MDG4788000.1 hypothetical protein [Micromonospora sp. WMMD1102]
MRKTVGLGANGLLYTGYHDNPSDPAHDGGYTIGFQTVDEFLDRGPLDEQLPAADAEEIRAYLVELARPTAAIELVAVADEGRFLERVSAHLDGVCITAGRQLTPGDEGVVFFAGAIGLGDHVLGAAFRFVTHGAALDIAQSKDETFTVAAGERLRIVFTTTEKTATAVMTRSTAM